VSTPPDPLEPDPALIRPTVDDVAALENTRTVGPNGQEIGTFTADTRPTAADVEKLIDQALEAVLSQLPTRFGTSYYERTKHNVALYTAILVEGSFFREKLDEGSVELYRDLLRTGLLSLQASIGADPAGEGETVVGSRNVDSVALIGVAADRDPIWEIERQIWWP
jgi:hypothetical protein